MSLQNKLSNREKRLRYLQEIFEFYDKSDGDDDGVMNVTKFWSFCKDFDILDTFLNKKQLTQLFGKTSLSVKGMIFTEFLEALSAIAQIIFKNDLRLQTNFDRVEEMYKYMGIDDPYVFRSKLKNDLSIQA